MKAAILYKPLSLEVKEVDIPRPKSKELVIKVDTSGLCPSDVKVYRYGGYNVKYPVILGHEVSGEVYSIGDDVEGFKEKDRVVVAADAYCGKCRMCRIGKENICDDQLSLGYNVDGAHADYMLVPSRFIERGGVLKVPDWMPLEPMAMTEPFACTIHSLRILNVKYDDGVLIIGDGPMSLMHVIVAKAFGISKIAVIGLNDWKLKLAESLGATHVYKGSDKEKVIESVKNDFPNGLAGVSVTVVNEETVYEALKLSSKGGKVVIFSGLPINNSRYIIDSNMIHYNEIELTGSSGYTYEEFELAYRMLLKDYNQAMKIVTHRFMLEDIHKAIKAWDDKESSLKVLLKRS